MATSAMMPVHCEKKGENEYALGITVGEKADVESIVDESLGTDVCIIFILDSLSPRRDLLETRS